MAPQAPPASVADFKAWYTRGFKYSDGPDGVMDSDIQKAIALAQVVFNPSLFPGAETKPVFLLVVAYFVVASIQAAGGVYAAPVGAPGMSGPDATRNSGTGVIGEKTVEKVTLRYAGLDQLIERYPVLAQFRQNDFGCQYALLVAPRLAGRVGLAANMGAPDAVIPAVPFLA